MTEQELKEIEERANAATPGPWRLYVGVDTYDNCTVETHEGKDICNGPSPKYAHVIKNDFEFIAHARDDVPILVEEIHCLKKLIQEMLGEAGSCDIERGHCVSHLQRVPCFYQTVRSEYNL